MADIVIRQVPSFLHEWLKKEAERNYRSMNREVLILLKQCMEKIAPTGEFPADLQGVCPRVKLSDIWEMFIQRYEAAPNSLTCYRQKLRNFMKWASDVIYVDEVSREVAEEYTRYLYKKRHSAQSQLGILKRIWATLWPDRVNPWNTGLRLLAKPRERVLQYRRLSVDEARRIHQQVRVEIELRRAPDRGAKRRRSSGEADRRRSVPLVFLEDLYDGMLFAWHYGMRISSLAVLQWKDFAPAFKKGYFLHVPPKTKRIKPWPLEIPVIPVIHRILMERKRRLPHADENYVLPAFHERYAHHPSAITTVVRRIRLGVGVEDDHHGRASMHSFRASFITRMDEAGAPSSVTDSITGHAPQSMHDRYSHVNLATKRKWLLKAIPALEED